MLNPLKLKIVVRVCVACKHIYGCHFFSNKLTCDTCFIGHNCPLYNAPLTTKKDFSILQSTGIEITGGSCDGCHLNRKSLTKGDLQ